MAQKSAPSKSAHKRVHTFDLRSHLLLECEAMVTFCFANGKDLDPKTVGLLAKIKRQTEEDPTGKDLEELATVHDRLQQVLKPTRPATAVLIQRNRFKNQFFGFLGPVPLVRRLMLVAFLSLISMLAVSLFQEVNSETMHQGLLDNNGPTLLVNLIFLLAASGVGASFAALYKANDAIEAGTYDSTTDAAYWAQMILGLVAGILLSELIPIPQQPNGSFMSQDFAKPILAILGGFSARAVYRILNFLIETIESLIQRAATQGGDDESNAKLMEANLRAQMADQRASMLEQANSDLHQTVQAIGNDSGADDSNAPSSASAPASPPPAADPVPTQAAPVSDPTPPPAANPVSSQNGVAAGNGAPQADSAQQTDPPQPVQGSLARPSGNS